MIEILLLVLSVCIDSFVASFAYGTNNIRIPIRCAMLISFVGSLMLGLSFFAGGLLRNVIPPSLSIFIGFAILMIIGLYRLFEGIFKAIIRGGYNSDKPLTFKLFDLNFVLTVYANETLADFDKSKVLSIKEALYLSIALSFDSLAIGFGASLFNQNYILTLFVCFIVGVLAIVGGMFLGKNLSKKTELSLSWLSGLILMLLAFRKLF